MAEPIPMTTEELRTMLGSGEKATRKSPQRLDANTAHEHAVAVLHTLRGLSKQEKTRVLQLALKLLSR
jgi:hypothetical protein